MTISHRIVLTETADGYAVQGYRCPQTGATSASYVSRFPGSTEAAVPGIFPGFGVVWSSTVARIPNGDYPADRIAHYVDLDDGPRVLCESAGPISIGSRVRIDGLNSYGDPIVAELAAQVAEALEGVTS